MVSTASCPAGRPRSAPRAGAPPAARRRAAVGAGRGGEMVPPAEFRSYYGRSVLKAPTWKARDIAGYFFLGGLAGGSALLAAGADATGRPGACAARRGWSPPAQPALSLAALVHDLGRPERFVHMLRVVKPTSPMSIGHLDPVRFQPARRARRRRRDRAACCRRPCAAASRQLVAGARHARRPCALRHCLAPALTTYTGRPRGRHGGARVARRATARCPTCSAPARWPRRAGSSRH